MWKVKQAIVLLGSVFFAFALIVIVRSSGSFKLRRLAADLSANEVLIEKYYGGSSSKDPQYVWRLKPQANSAEALLSSGYYRCDETDTIMVIESVREIEPAFTAGTNATAFRKSFSRHKNYVLFNRQGEVYLVVNVL